VVCLLASSAVLADGAATALGNRIRGNRDLDRVGDWANEIKDVFGGIAIIGDKMAIWGDVELVDL
jgi:ApbE superfamily uncharacterized protein (UPF0280 family)